MVLSEKIEVSERLSIKSPLLLIPDPDTHPLLFLCFTPPG